MSFENNYIRDLTQKYRIAVAIAVLKEKPKNIPTEEYLEELRNNLRNDNDEDLDLTICSDDFDIDDNDDINDKNNNEADNLNNIATKTINETNQIDTEEYFNEKSRIIDNTDEHCRNTASHIVNRNAIDSFKSVNNNTNMEFLNDIRFNDINCHSHNDNDDRKTDGSKADMINYSQNSENILKDYNDVFNLQALECNKKLDFVNVNTFDVAEKQNRTPDEEATQKNVQNDLDLDATFCETQISSQNNSNISKITNIDDEIALLENTNAYNERTVKTIDKLTAEVGNHKTINYSDSQATELYTVHGYTQNYTHVSKSQDYEQFVINEKFIKSKYKKISANYNSANENSKENVNITDKTEEIRNFNENRSKNMCEVKNKAVNISYENCDFNEINTKNISDSREHYQKKLTKDITTIEDRNYHSTIINEYMATDFVNSNKSFAFNNDSMDIQSFPIYAQDFNVDKDINTPKVKEVSEKYDEELNRSVEIREIEDIPNETEIVSFKVIEELNKVKSYINRRVERRASHWSLDSGYRSDSQRSTFRSSLQMSGNWLNQSAHSLYDYIMQCPLLDTTQDIVNEIAQVLGQLIDKLHVEEKYPTFIEDILNNVEFLLQNLLDKYDEEDVLLKKEETTKRLLLLNKSLHIQKYTIDKISTILENLQGQLSNPENTYEVSNISLIENIPYIFHVLEVILKLYLKERTISSQDDDESRIELKRSSLTDIWRKKWNIKYIDENTTVESLPKKCVVMKCNEVLNKMIVSCMEGYSLISFAALHCFNLLQS